MTMTPETPDDDAAIAMARLLDKARGIVERSTAEGAKDFDTAGWLVEWIERPQPALQGRRPSELYRVIAQAMQFGLLPDIQAMVRSLGLDRLRRTLSNTPPGVLSRCDLYFWHRILGKPGDNGLVEVPPGQPRSFHEWNVRDGGANRGETD